jgi:hypothetical protein
LVDVDTVRQGRRRPYRTGLHEAFDAVTRCAKKAKVPKLDGGFAADAA